MGSTLALDREIWVYETAGPCLVVFDRFGGPCLDWVFPICNGSGDYSTGDSFSFADLNGDLNGGDYKITIISMNATW